MRLRSHTDLTLAERTQIYLVLGSKKPVIRIARLSGQSATTTPDLRIGRLSHGPQ